MDPAPRNGITSGGRVFLASLCRLNEEDVEEQAVHQVGSHDAVASLNNHSEPPKKKQVPWQTTTTRTTAISQSMG